MKSLRVSCFGFLAMVVLILIAECGIAPAQQAPSRPVELSLIDFNSPDAGKQVVAAKGVPAGSDIKVDKTGVNVNFTPFQTGDADHPGLHITPATGKDWDLSAYGHVEAKITNTGDKGINIVMHVVPEGEGFWQEKNFEAMNIKPGETQTLKMIFGYQKGFKPSTTMKAGSVAEVFIFLYHSIASHTFRIEELKATGAPGEQPPIVPDPTAAKP